ncbi:MAG TPA: hypothetical protein VFP44_07955 [Usitatibacter sp.]|nr:hypothetical protein [Usitatibacter sp.]
MTTFQKTHPEYARIEAQIRKARAERALVIGEAIGNGLIATGHLFERVLHGWRTLFHVGKAA